MAEIRTREAVDLLMTKEVEILNKFHHAISEV